MKIIAISSLLMILINCSTIKACPSAEAFISEMTKRANSESVKINFLTEPKKLAILESIARKERLILISCSKDPPSEIEGLRLIWEELPNNLLNSFRGWKGRAFLLISARKRS